MSLIDSILVQRLIAAQFPQWKHLPIWPVERSGWDNRTFHLGKELLVRLPSAAEYEVQVEKEHLWLPKLAPQLPLAIPAPLAMGKPAEDFPWKWSIYRWLEGEAVASSCIVDLCDLATSLAQFLTALQRIDSKGGPLPGYHSFFRGGDLRTYEDETRQSMALLKEKIDVETASAIWEAALLTSWSRKPVWVHGDISAGNLLIQNGKLKGVIDFGQLAVGDPACDLAIAWTLFRDDSRNIFRRSLVLDSGTWARGRAWTLWKALIIAAGLTESNTVEGERCWYILEELFKDYTQEKQNL